MTTSSNFKNVVFVGPSLDGRGGMEQLARLYKAHFNILYLPTNSPHGTFAGFFILILTCLRLPYYRFNHKILHIHVASGKSFFRKAFLALYGRCLGYKIIMHNHAGDFPQFVDKTGKWLVLSCLKLANKIIVLSEYWQQYFENNLGCKNISIVPNIADKQFSPINKDETPIRFLFLGALTRNKGVDLLLKAFSKVLYQFPGQVKLTIAGVGPMETQLKQMAETLNINDYVDFVGWVDKNERDFLLAKSHVVVLPSNYECQPMALLEGLTSGCGIVATRVGGIPDIVKHNLNGILIEPGDTNGIIDAMTHYCVDQFLREKHATYSCQLLEKYSSERVKNDLLKIYNTSV